MPTIAVKLERFRADIMRDVTEKKKAIETRVENKLAKEFEQLELQYLEDAYEIIQNGLKKIDKEKNEVISKTQMENKVKMLAKRKEIIDKAFNQARVKIEAYTKTEEYKRKLIQKIKEHMEFLGDGNYIIYINYKDKELYKELQEAFPDHKVFIEKKHIEMLGGCKLLNTTTNVYLDDSYEKRLEGEEENFLQQCGLEINEKVGDQ